MSTMISVCICTYNRAELLARMLASLAGQHGVNWCAVEVVVIDNNCTDATAQVLERAAVRLPLRHVVETAQGLSHARNRALREARGEWIVFTDDDVILEPGWLAAYHDGFVQYPEADFAGGRILPEWPDGTPAWYRGNRLQLLDGVLVHYDIGSQTRMLTAHDPLFFGASFALRAGLSAKTGAFRTDLGMSGQSLGRGEETEYMRRAWQQGAQGLYVADSICFHPADPCRLTMRALFRYGKASGEAHRAIVDPHASGTLLSAAGYLARGVYQLLKGRGDRFRECVINAGIQAALA